MSVGKKPKVGNRYYYGLHMIPCRKADGVLAVRMADKVVWEGAQGDGFIDIDDKEAFGGDEREGGFSGRIAVMLGKPLQAANAYLANLFGNLTPAYRGVVSLIFQRPYFNANSARLPALQFKMLNVEDIHKGWLPHLAIVDASYKSTSASVYIVMDLGNSMKEDGKNAIQGAALATFIRSMKGGRNAVQVEVRSSFEIRNFSLNCESDGDYEDLAQFVEFYSSIDPDEPTWGGTWQGAFDPAPQFFEAARNFRRKPSGGGLLDQNLGQIAAFFGGETSAQTRRIIVFTTDGINDIPGDPEAAAAILAGIENVEVYCFNILETDTTQTAKLDNTPQDGIPVITAENSGLLRDLMNNVFLTWADLNPAHIQRCLLIDPMRGGTATPDQIGDSFAIAAQEYFDEGFGLSVRFSGADGNLRDRLEIDRHCDAVTYLSRATGKWEHRRVREDFDIGDLPVLDGTVVKDWTRLRRPKRRELPNKLTVIYTDRTNGKSASITRSNPVGVRQAGRVRKGQDSRYPFVTIPRLAERLCVRDLTASSDPLLAGDLPLAYLPAGFEIATVVLLRVPKPGGGFEDVPARITEIRHGAGTDASVWLKVVEQRFDLGAGLPPLPPPPVESLPGRARPAELRLVAEAPYQILVEQVGQADVDAALAEEPGLGRVLVAAARPNGQHLDALVAIDPGSGWQEEGRIDFSAAAMTLEPLAAEGDARQVRIEGNATLVQVTAGQLALIGEEILRIDAMDLDGSDVVMTVGRACLDTAPAFHPAFSTILFFGPGEVMETGFMEGESVDVALLTRTGSDLLGLGAAPVDSVFFASRAIRPYPPGRLQINGSFAQNQFTEEVELTWAHRDRRMQTAPIAEDHEASDIGPEPGTTYTVTVEAEDEWGGVLALLAEEDVGSLTGFEWTDFSGLPPDTARVAFSVASLRDGYLSWQRPRMRVARFLAPADGFIEEVT
jgi:hypothetical protein